MQPLTDVREISRIGYGFMASKTLFASLNLDLYSRLSGRPQTLAELAGETGIAANRLLTLLTACVSLGLLAVEGDRYANAPASEAYLVRSAPTYFGDYFRFQIDRQAYPVLEHLDAALRGEPVRSIYDMVASDSEEAEHFSRAQHVGSLGPAHMLARQVDLSGRTRLLDVAGGTGAFSIALCRRYPELQATILDFPSVVEVARRYIDEAGLGARIDFLPSDAFATAWPSGQDVVVLSYLLSAVEEGRVQELLDRARDALAPGGIVLLHDFMVDDDRTGPATAAVWLLFSITADPGAVSLTPAWLSELLQARGFGDIAARDLIPGITKLITARKMGEAGSAA